MPTRSARLASGKPAAAVTTNLGTVPNGYTWLVKSATVFNGAGVADFCYLYLQDAAGNLSFLLYQTALASNGHSEWEGWAALNPGDSLFAFSTQGSSMFWVSGAKLPGVA
jgi:hypothetical protein